MSTAIHRNDTPDFRGTELVWTSEGQSFHHDASCPCCGLSLELVAEFAAFQRCVSTAAPREPRVLVAA